MGILKHKGFADPIVLAIVVTCLIIGGLAVIITKKPDSPVEQAAEAVLHVEGIDIDFSAGSKNVQKPSTTTTESN